MSSNDHITGYLDYFAHLEEPGFAVLIDGAWGCGKTFMIRKFIESRAEYSGLPPINISLYGVENARDIDFSLAASQIALLKNKRASAIAGAGFTLLSKAAPFLKKIKNIDPAVLLPSLKKRLVIVDDLERCPADLQSVMGYLNGMVEHQGANLVLLSNTEEIKSATREDEFSHFLRTKEKFVGRSFHVQPEVDEAINAFSEKFLVDSMSKHRDSLVPLLQELHELNGTNNLRLLEHTIRELSRVLLAIDSKKLNNDEFLKAFVCIFFALFAEYAGGKLTAEMLRTTSILTPTLGNKEDGPNAILKKYELLRIPDSILGSKDWASLISRGWFDESGLNASIEGSIYFKSTEMPEWQIVWHRVQQQDDLVEESIKEMVSKFKSRDWSDSRIILHVFGLLLSLADEKLISLDRKQVLNEGKAYVRNLRDNDLMDDYLLSDSGSGDHLFGLFGLGVHEKESAEFCEFLDALREASESVRTQGWQDAAKTILEELSLERAEALAKLSGQSAEGEAVSMADGEVLRCIDPGDLGDIIRDMSSDFAFELVQALQRRRRRVPDTDGSVAKWIERVSSSLQDASKSENKIKRSRLSWISRQLREMASNR